MTRCHQALKAGLEGMRSGALVLTEITGNESYIISPQGDLVCLWVSSCEEWQQPSHFNKVSKADEYGPTINCQTGFSSSQVFQKIKLLEVNNILQLSFLLVSHSSLSFCVSHHFFFFSRHFFSAICFNAILANPNLLVLNAGMENKLVTVA